MKSCSTSSKLSKTKPQKFPKSKINSEPLCNSRPYSHDHSQCCLKFKPTPKTKKEIANICMQNSFIEKVALLKIEAGEKGFFKTMNALDNAVRVVGWEVAEMRHPKK